MDLQKLVDKKALQEVDYLHWLAKTLSDELLAGAQLSLRSASGVEFSQYKNYQSGDDLRMLDWKLLARSGRYFIKEAQQERMIQVRFVLDCSKSMALNYGDLSKLDYAKIMCATLAFMVSQQGDQLLLVPVNNQMQNSARQGTLSLVDFLFQLTQIKADGQWPEQPAYQILQSRPAEREMVVLLSDFYEHHLEIESIMKSISQKYKHWTSFHLMHEFELEADYPADAELEDLESGQRMMIGGSGVKKQMKQKMESFVEHWAKLHQSQGQDYQLVNTAIPLSAHLLSFLKNYDQLK